MEAPTSQRSRISTDWRWPLWAVGTGIFGAIGHLFTMDTVSEEETRSGTAFIESLNHTSYHIGIVAGLIATFCLIAFTAGWFRRVHQTSSDSLAAWLVGLAMLASAGAMIVGYGFKGSLAIYLPGGMNDNIFTNEALLTIFMIDDFAPFLAWWGIAFGAIGIAWLGIKERRVPRWLGFAGLFFALVPIGFVVGTGLPGFPGVIDPLWMIVFGTGLALSLRSATSSATVSVSTQSGMMTASPAD